MPCRENRRTSVDEGLRKTFVKQFAALLFVCISAVAAAPVAASPQEQTNPEAPGMTLVPGGDFWMARVPFFIMHEIGWLQRDRLDDEPAHKVSVDAFYVDKYEVTNEDYKRFTDATKRKTPWHWAHGAFAKGEERIPVTNVDWQD